MKEYSFIVIDTETCGLNPIKHDIIELSLIRLSTNEQKTWYIKPINPDNIDKGALRVNGYKIEDLLHQTAYGRETFQEASQVIIDVENWLAEDGMPTEKRILIAQNASFDRAMVEQLWTKCGAIDAFPFGRRYLDTMVIEMFMDYAQQGLGEGYHLAGLIKKYGITNSKAHTAASDCKATQLLFEAQVKSFQQKIK